MPKILHISNLNYQNCKTIRELHRMLQGGGTTCLMIIILFLLVFSGKRAYADLRSLPLDDDGLPVAQLFFRQSEASMLGLAQVCQFWIAFTRVVEPEL